MKKTTRAAKANKNTRTVFEIVNERILSLIESTQLLPWRKPWSVKDNGPRNVATLKPYRGINRWLLGQFGDYFLTFRQARELGGRVKAGAKGLPVVYWSFTDKRREVEDQATGEKTTKTEKVAFLRFYTVFALADCEIPADKLPPVEEPTNPGAQPIEAAEAIFRAMPNPPRIVETTGEDRACYSPALDAVRIPRIECFYSPEERVSTMAHELAHATGHPSRLNRKGVAECEGYGTESYGFEELVAEFAAAGICGTAGVETTVEQSAAYIKGWTRAIQGILAKDPRALVMAAAQGEKAARYILGEIAEQENGEEAAARAAERRAGEGGVGRSPLFFAAVLAAGGAKG